ncbi:MAG: nitrate reductase molybdenum cofactor assembly chaperone [Jatrophihabitantaceae bacterium]
MSAGNVGELARARALQAGALCLNYPDGTVLEHLDLLADTAAALPKAAGLPLSRFVTHLRSTDPGQLARDYVEIFDLRRRCCLYLTYYSHGDTRKRGMALLEFTHAYRGAGVTLVGGELPDHLGLVCEVAVRAPETGLGLLRDNRAGVELLRTALADAGSAYVDVLDTIRAVLPDAAPKDLQRALALARSGPPAEEVGLEPFAPPEYMGARR